MTAIRSCSLFLLFSILLTSCVSTPVHKPKIWLDLRGRGVFESEPQFLGSWVPSIQGLDLQPEVKQLNFTNEEIESAANSLSTRLATASLGRPFPFTVTSEWGLKTVLASDLTSPAGFAIATATSVAQKVTMTLCIPPDAASSEALSAATSTPTATATAQGVASASSSSSNSLNRQGLALATATGSAASSVSHWPGGSSPAKAWSTSLVGSFFVSSTVKSWVSSSAGPLGLPTASSRPANSISAWVGGASSSSKSADWLASSSSRFLFDSLTVASPVALEASRTPSFAAVTPGPSPDIRSGFTTSVSEHQASAVKRSQSSPHTKQGSWLNARHLGWAEVKADERRSLPLGSFVEYTTNCKYPTLNGFALGKDAANNIVIITDKQAFAEELDRLGLYDARIFGRSGFELDVMLLGV